MICARRDSQQYMQATSAEPSILDDFDVNKANEVDAPEASGW
jgi:hypothetical protein